MPRRQEEINDPERRSIRLTIIDEINAAFDGVNLDGGITIQQARAMDDYEGEVAQLVARAKDTEIRWQDVSDDKLRDLQDVHVFLDPKGYRFYIPAFLIWVLRHQDDAITSEHSGLESPTIFSLDIHALNSAPDRTWSKGQTERFSRLSTRQARSICMFLRFLARYDSGWKQEAETYLSAYWGRFCAERQQG